MNTRLTRNITSALLLAIFLFAYASSNFFWHKHRVNDTIIVHSHPFSGSPDSPRHIHSSFQTDLIAHFTLWLMLAAGGWVGIKKPRCPVCTFSLPGPKPVICKKQDNTSLRAPPSVF